MCVCVCVTIEGLNRMKMVYPLSVFNSLCAVFSNFVSFQLTPADCSPAPGANLRFSKCGASSGLGRRFNQTFLTDIFLQHNSVLNVSG